MVMGLRLQGTAVELKTMAPGDGAVLKTLLSHPEVKPHIQLRQGAASQQGVPDQLVKRMLHGYDPCALHAGIYMKDQPELIGTVSLQNWNRHEGKALLGYMLNPLWWGRGFATEAVGLLLAYGFREQGLLKVEGRCRGDNSRSEKVMLRSGLTLERILPMPGSPDDVMKVFTLLHN
ncbi:GNAT family N-acetyltransferase [Paenibacillus sp. MMS20-IR301]|uniref:GNAT family N-acetyltransferase n=1 Tax=Paenibacillus sp. MMS20-IR301 TaxID=2895946 RepID=UPI0028E468FE|nr:GNAT family N-acetyltransferase [Paenibacillus sp. MMS20-IR301]WNS43355.1 GNAT family N-acetyltransferase [Paenibacillus sp. MMS20-IR301]